MSYPLGLCWIRRDLRLDDHRALAEACDQCAAVVLVFVFDENILGHLKDQDDRRLTFIYESLREVDVTLKTRHSRLIVRYGDPVEQIPQLASELGAAVVFTNHDYEPSAKVRDQEVREGLKKDGREFYSYLDQVIFERRDLLTGSGQAYRKFTPYKNSWLRDLKPEHLKEWKPKLKNVAAWDALKFKSKAQSVLEFWNLEKMGFVPHALWLKPGSKAGHQRLDAFESKISEYRKGRDFPALSGTSGLSAHLRFGTVSIRACARRARLHKSAGALTWLSELIWRDFYQMILDQYPHVIGHAFKESYETIKWPGSEAHFKKWCAGETGYPLIDAAMRHFNETGWMHNRLRMVVAMFLTKDLLVDWRKGEAYFARYLLDFDLSANNGGWQWSASTGVDAQPYFRIFNPIAQSEKFDPDGEFIKSVIPELKNESQKSVHWPHGEKNNLKVAGYCAPLVEHKTQRDLALALFKRTK